MQEQRKKKYKKMILISGMWSRIKIVVLHLQLIQVNYKQLFYHTFQFQNSNSTEHIPLLFTDQLLYHTLSTL